MHSPCCCCCAAEFTYNENKTGALYFPGATHKGFTAIANTLWCNGLRAALYRHAVLGNVTAVSVAGHSLGAGVAQLVAYAAQVRRLVALHPMHYVLHKLVTSNSVHYCVPHSD
jgi:esterase/lipase